MCGVSILKPMLCATVLLMALGCCFFLLFGSLWRCDWLSRHGVGRKTRRVCNSGHLPQPLSFAGVRMTSMITVGGDTCRLYLPKDTS